MHPEPLFKIFNLPVYAYGICMAVGIIACFVFLMFTMWYKKFNDEAINKILLIGVFGTGFGIFSAMLFQATYNYIANPSGGFNLGDSMTFIGGLLGGVISFLAVYWIYIYAIAPRTKIKLLQNHMNATLTDALPFIPIAICIAHAFGRFGCFFGGCCYGKPDPDYGIACAQGFSELLQMDMTGVKVVPLQLFEMAFLLVLAGCMAFLYFKYKFNYNFGVYAIFYGVWRFVIEFYRGDDRGEFLGTALSPSQFWSILMVLVGIGYIFLQIYVFSKHMKHPELHVEEKTAEPDDAAAEEKPE